MKFFVIFAFVIAATFVAASPAGNSGSSSIGIGSSGGSAGGAGASINQDAAESEVQQAAQPVAIQPAVDLPRFRKSAGYGANGANIPAPPCPKNYLFSCQPNLSPIACSAPAPSYGSQGAYSAPIATYVTPLRGNYGVPQGIGYTNQFYQY